MPRRETLGQVLRKIACARGANDAKVASVSGRTTLAGWTARIRHAASVGMAAGHF